MARPTIAPFNAMNEREQAAATGHAEPGGAALVESTNATCIAFDRKSTRNGPLIH
jgi:hypothetical protein